MIDSRELCSKRRDLEGMRFNESGGTRAEEAPLQDRLQIRN